MIKALAELLKRLFTGAFKWAPGAPVRPQLPPWLAAALPLIGTYEVPGSGDNPTILAWAEFCGFDDYKHDSIAWCALFVNYCLQSTGQDGTNSLMALSFASYGTKLKGPAVGAIFSKRRAGGGGHTGIIVGRNSKGALICVSGNVSDAVRLQAVFPAEVVSYNWPADYPLPAKVGLDSLPLTSTADRAASEA